jgi:putative Holliday junction resolvase
MDAPAPPGRLLGIDYGRVRVGIAVCDELGILASPLGFIPRPDDLSAARTVAALAARERAVGLVIGLPLHAAGQAGANVRWVRAFAKILRGVCPLPLHEVDERYSSSEAEERLRARGTWPPANRGDVDALSAAIVLERYLAGER